MAEDEILVPFDVVSHFTCILTGVAVQVACWSLEGDLSLSERIDLSVDDIVSLLSLCLDATFLSFWGKVYRQIHGTATVSPVSVVVANPVMQNGEEKAGHLSFPSSLLYESAMRMSHAQPSPRTWSSYFTAT